MFNKSKVFLMLILFMLAMVLVGCNFIVPGANEEPSAKVTITSVSDYWWTTKGTGVELLGRGFGTCTVTVTGNGNVVTCEEADGTDGIDGVDGTNGTNGIDGAIGPQGPASADGEDGVEGVVGQAGQTGATGATGQAGQDYVPPEYIYVYYTITNTGNVNIQEYIITFEAETDGGVYMGIAIGEDLAVGATVYSYVKTKVKMI